MPSALHPSFARALRRAARAPLVAGAVTLVLLDDAFRIWVRPAAAWLARLGLMRRLEAWIAGLSPYATLALFLVPLAIIEPLKLCALYLFSEGRWLMGVLTFVVAKVVGIGLAERLFAVSREKLLSIGWFAASYRRVIALRDAVHAWLERSEAWQAAKAVAARLRDAAGRGIASARAVLGGWFTGKGRIAAARRFLSRRSMQPQTISRPPTRPAG